MTSPATAGRVKPTRRTVRGRSRARGHKRCMRNAQAPEQSESYIRRCETGHFAFRIFRSAKLDISHFAHFAGAKPDTSQFRRVRNRTLHSFAPGHFAARHSQRVSGGVVAKMQRLEVVRGHPEFLSHFSIPQANPTQPVFIRSAVYSTSSEHSLSRNFVLQGVSGVDSGLDVCNVPNSTEIQ